jgi:hypothetical protein
MNLRGSTRRSQERQAGVLESGTDHESPHSRETDRPQQEVEQLRERVAEQAKQIASLERQLALARPMQAGHLWLLGTLLVGAAILRVVSFAGLTLGDDPAYAHLVYGLDLRGFPEFHGNPLATRPAFLAPIALRTP